MAEGQQLKSVTIKRGKDAPVGMMRGSAAFGDGKCYFVSGKETDLHMYDLEKNDWSVLRNTPYRESSLAVVEGLLTAVGGQRGTLSSADHEYTNKLYSLSNRRWIEKFPEMKMDPALGINPKKDNPAVVQYGNSLLVIGGRNVECQPQSRVDVLDTKTLEWSDAPELPETASAPTAAICGDELYVIKYSWGGSVMQCFLDELLGQSKPAGSVWSTVAKPPHEYSTCASLCGQLVAIGGNNDAAAIHAYDPNKNSWYQIGKLAMGREKSLVAQLSEDKLIVVGGERKNYSRSVITEIITGVV